MKTIATAAVAAGVTLCVHGDALKAWYDAELKRLDREVRAIGRIEART